MAALALAMAMRVWGLGRGLPEFLDEAVPFRKALEMWRLDGTVDWNPHFFHYPSLAIYLHLALQAVQQFVARTLGQHAGTADYLLSFAIDPTPSVLLGRCLYLAADLLTVWLVWRIGERLHPGVGLASGALTACSPIMFATSRAMYVDTLLATLVVASLAGMSGLAQAWSKRRLAGCALWIGLAAGAKYPGAALLAPLALVAWARRGPAGLGLWLLAVALSAATFLLTTPFALLDRDAFAGDVEAVSQLGAAGALGSIGVRGFAYDLRLLARDLGWIGLASLPISLIGGCLSRARGAASGGRPRLVLAVLWTALILFGVPIALAHIQAQRYLAPVVPIAALLACDGVFRIVRWIADVGSRRRSPWTVFATRSLAPALLLLACLPALVSGALAAWRPEHDTRLEAKRWAEHHLRPDALVLQEFYGPPLPGRADHEDLIESPIFRAASPALQERHRARRWWSTATIPLITVGTATIAFRARDGSIVDVPLQPHASDLNLPSYDPRLFQEADYVITSSAVRARFAGDPRRYFTQSRMYALLDSVAEVGARFPASGDHPEIVIYRIGPRARTALLAFGPLDPLWWTDYIPMKARLQIESLQPEEIRTAGRPRTADGERAAWVADLIQVFETRYEPFVRNMAMELRERGRFAALLPFAEALVAMHPDDVPSVRMAAEAARRLGDWQRARRVVERAMVGLARQGTRDPLLLLEYAEILEHDREWVRARAALVAVAASGQPAAPVARARLDDPARPYRTMR